MSKRGAALRDHILYSAKTVFLEFGFERASMDQVALAAKTSKRTLYAHFESKEKLYLAIIELVREMYLSKLKSPSDYSQDPEEALTMFCGRYLESLLYHWTIRMCRMMISEAERFPEGSQRYFDVIFTAPRELLEQYIQQTFELSPVTSAKSTQQLLNQVIEPRFIRTLFRIDRPLEDIAEDFIDENFDLSQVRTSVQNLLTSLEQERPEG